MKLYPTANPNPYLRVDSIIPATVTTAGDGTKTTHTYGVQATSATCDLTVVVDANQAKRLRVGQWVRINDGVEFLEE